MGVGDVDVGDGGSGDLVDRQDAGPDRPGCVFGIIARGAGADFHGGFGEVHRQDGGGFEFLGGDGAQGFPAAGEQAVHEGFEGGAFFVVVFDQAGGAEAHDGAVVDGVMEAGAGEDVAVEEGGGEAGFAAAGVFAQHAAGGAAVPVDGIALTPVQRGNNHGAAFDDVADMAVRRGVKNGVDGVAVEVATLVHAAQAGEIGGGFVFHAAMLRRDWFGGNDRSGPDRLDQYHAVLAEEAEEREERDAEDGGVFAFDAVKKMDAGAFETVGADAGGDVIRLGGEVGFEEAVGEVAHAEAGAGDMVPDAVAVAQADDGGDEFVGAAAEMLEVPGGAGPVGRFVEPGVFADQELVAADDEGVGVMPGDAFGLEFGEEGGDVGRAGALGLAGLFDGGLVDGGGVGVEGEAGGGEDRAPGGGGAGEDEAGGSGLEHGDQARGSAADLARRDCQLSISWTMVAAVSSMERRVTSMTGQPRRVQRRLDQRISAFTAS